MLAELVRETPDVVDAAKYRTRKPLPANDLVDAAKYRTRKPLPANDLVDAAKYRTRKPLPANDLVDAAKYRTHKPLPANDLIDAAKCSNLLGATNSPLLSKAQGPQTSRSRASSTRCDTVTHSPYATVPYNSPLVDDSLNGRALITARSNLAENDRQLTAVDIDCRAHANGQMPLHRSLLNSISQLLGIQTADSELLPGALPVAHTKQRDLQVRLCMNDPLISEEHRMAHRLYVTGKPISELRAAGIEAVHLSEIGVTYDDWSQCCDMGVRDLVFLNADWPLLLQMGFQPRHIVTDRSKAGANVLSEPPLCINYQILEETLGLTVDEAIFTHAFTTADFAVLGETITTLRRRGFELSHVQQMREPAFNFESALRATPAELAILFPSTESIDSAVHIDPPTRPKLPNPVPKPKKPLTHTKKAFSVF